MPTTPESNRTAEGTHHALLWLEGHAPTIPKLRRLLRRYYLTSARPFPWRLTRDPYCVLVAEILLQKTAAGPVQRIWNDLVTAYPDAGALAAARPADVESLIRPLGLHKRAAALIAASHALVQQAQGALQPDPGLLRSLPGVGPYAVSAVLSFAFGVKASVIDVNAARVYTRIAAFRPVTHRQALAFALVLADRTITAKSHRQVNYAILDLGAQVCRPAPVCTQCPLATLCASANSLHPHHRL